MSVPGRPSAPPIAVLALLAVPAALAACSGSSAAQRAATTSPPEAPPPSAHTIELEPFPAIRLVAPEGWVAFEDWGLTRDPESDRAMAIMFWRVQEIYAEPCRWRGTLIDPGSGVADLAYTLAAIPERNATNPAPVEVGGVDGLYLEWSVPIDEGLDWAGWSKFLGCDDGYYESWVGAGGSDRYQQAPGQIDRLWILDVDGERLVIDAFHLPGTPAPARDDIDAIVASIRFADPHPARVR